MVLVAAGVFGALYVLIGVGIGHAHHSSHRHPAEGVVEGASLLLPLWVVAAGIALLVTSTRRGLRFTALLAVLFIANFAVVLAAGRMAEGSQYGNLAGAPPGTVMALPAPGQ